METKEPLLQDLLARRPPLPDIAWRGRGIVICAGGVRMFTNAWVLVRLLRGTLNCTLPIEIWHLGPDEMSGGMREMLERQAVEVVDAHRIMSHFPAAISDGWQLKAYALIMSRFQDALLLDADNVPVRDPSFIFESAEFAEAGAVFWPDGVDLSASNPIWEAVGLPAEQRIAFESGQVAINKSRHRRALHALLCLNENSDRFYQLIYGDKDTFLMAWLATGSPFVLMPHRPFVDRHVIYQRDVDGEVLFQHRINSKWTYAGPQSASGAFRHGEACEEAVAELRHIWNGRIFHPPRQSRAAVALQRSMEGRTFLFSRPGYDDREIELLQGCQIGRGRDFDSETWVVGESEPGVMRLTINDRHETVWTLDRRSDDRWVEASDQAGAVALKAVGGPASPRPPDVSLIRDLISTVLHNGRWNGEAARELEVLLRTLNRINPSVSDELSGYIHSTFFDDAATGEGLLVLLQSLRHDLAKIPPRRGQRSDPELLSDPDFYVKA